MNILHRNLQKLKKNKIHALFVTREKGLFQPKINILFPNKDDEKGNRLNLSCSVYVFNYFYENDFHIIKLFVCIFCS